MTVGGPTAIKMSGGRGNMGDVEEEPLGALEASFLWPSQEGEEGVVRENGEESR